MSGTIRRLAGTAVAVLLASVSWVCAQTPPRTVPSTTDLSAAIEGTARLVGASVVEIFTTSYRPGEGVIPGTADLVMTQRGSGSGVIVDPAGYIVTNAHVVRGAQRLRIELPIPAVGNSILATGSRTVSGQIVGIDLETDLAVVKVEDKNLPAVGFGDSEELRTGRGG